METHALSLLLIALATLLLLPPGPGLRQPVVGAEYSTKTDPDYEFGDYRGKWCIDDHGFVYNIGEVYFPSPTACPCTCTVDGPVCVRPRCPRIHPRCTRIRFKACCPVCEAMARVCVYGGKTYRPLEEFRLSRCERCRCEANREVYCSISDCPAPHCVNPTYQPNHCCPICKTESWLQQEDFVSLNESTPSNYSNHHIVRSTGRGGRVATIFHSDLLISPLPINSYS
nr:von Willebrand factor C domain-containing protein 2-like isoform X2 [Nothobranchius furzeri]